MMNTRQRGVIDVAIVLCACFALAAWAFYSWADGRGYDRAVLESAKAERARKQADDKERERQDKLADESKQRLRDDATQLTDQLKEAKDHAKNLQIERDSALRAGTQRMSIRTANCVPAVISTDGTAKSGAVGYQEARAELVAEDAAEILAITDGGDDAIRDLNFCIDRYNGAAAEIERYKAGLKGVQHVEAAKPAQAH